MSRFVVDASVAVKWFVPEIHSREAVTLLDSAHTLLAPDLVLTEVANALWKKTRRGELRPGEARLVLGSLAAVGLELVPSRELVEAALELALRAGCTVYDGVYLALAIHHNCPLVTADRRLRTLTALRGLAKHLMWLPALV